jgi:hypothetical protein
MNWRNNLLGKIELGPGGYPIEGDDVVVMFFIRTTDSIRSLLLLSYHPTISAAICLADSPENNNN